MARRRGGGARPSMAEATAQRTSKAGRSGSRLAVLLIAVLAGLAVCAQADQVHLAEPGAPSLLGVEQEGTRNIQGDSSTSGSSSHEQPGKAGRAASESAADKAREADRLYASSLKILASLKQRSEAAQNAAALSAATSLAGTSSLGGSGSRSSGYAGSYGRTSSALLRPSSYTPLLDWLEDALTGRTRYLHRAVGLVRKWTDRNRNGPRGREATAKSTSASSRIPVFGRWLARAKSSGSDEQTRVAMAMAVSRLEAALELGKTEAALVLADLHLYGRYSLDSNATQAAVYYQRAAEATGDAHAQYMLGFLHSTNYGASVYPAATDGEAHTGKREGEGDQGTALLQYTFSALAGQTEAEMTLGYRYWTGIGVKQNCPDALPWYKAAADKAIQSFEGPGMPPGGRHLPPPKVRLADVLGGVYGPGSSAVSSHPSSHHHSSHAGHHHPTTEREWEDVLEFYQFHADRGDSTFMFRIGRIYYQGFNPLNPEGGSTLENGGRDFARALRWFTRIARSVWPRDPIAAYVNPSAPQQQHHQPANLQQQGKTAGNAHAQPTGPARQVSHQAYYNADKDIKLKVEDSLSLAAGLAAGYLGRMYLRGEGFPEQDYQRAYLWFQRGISQGDRESHNGLGIMYRDGLGVPKDLIKAFSHFQTAAQADHAEALVNLGKMHLARREYHLAIQQFEAAIRQGDSFQAYYYLAEINSSRSHGTDSCPMATAFYKLVAEKGDWETSQPWWEAERAWAIGDLDRALLGYWIMAERGYEVAQNNVAWILDQDKQRLTLPFYDIKLSTATDRLALVFWTRSAAQQNVDALVKMGDYYLKGLGVPSGIPQPEKAAACYASAAGTQVSSLAMHNLGWMHENGIGVSQDFHLAKRYYDLSLSTNSEAYLPVTLSLVKLHLRSLYKAVMAGDIKAISLFLSNELEYEDVDANGEEGRPIKPWFWSWRKLRDEFVKRWIGEEMARQQAQRQIQQQEARTGGGVNPVPGANGQAAIVDPAQRAVQQGVRAAMEAQDDPVAWARQRREEMLLREQQDEFADDLDIPDFFGDTIGARGGEGSDDLLETLAIVGLCLVLGWLVYIRQARYDGARARQQAAAAPAEPVPAGDRPAAAVNAPQEIPARGPDVPPTRAEADAASREQQQQRQDQERNAAGTGSAEE